MNFILVLVVVVGICSFAQARVCEDLDEKQLSANPIVLSSPYSVVYDPYNNGYYGAFVYYTLAVNSNYDGSSTYILNNTVIDNMDIKFGTPEHRWDTHLDCINGTNTTHRFLNITTDETVGLCIFSCDVQGINMDGFQCHGTYKWTPTDLKNALEAIADIPGAPKDSQLQEYKIPKGRYCAIL